MFPRPTLLLLVALLAPACPLFAQTTWTVDEDLAAGADFLEIQPAVDAASPGDIVLVGPGSYSPFHLSKGLTIQGSLDAVDALQTRVEGGSFVVSMLITGLPASEQAVVDDLDLYGATVQDCDGVVVLDRLRFQRLRSELAADLRVHRNVPPVLAAAPSAEVELVESVGELVRAESTFGLRMVDPDPLTGPACDIHLALPQSIGEDADILDDVAGGGCLWRYGSRPGLWVDGASVVATGDEESRLQGGAESVAACGYEGASNGIHVSGDGDVRVGPIAVESGGGGAAAIFAAPGSTVTMPSTIDPSMEIVGVPRPGDLVWFKVYGEPGDTAFLHLGRQAARVPMAGSPISRLTTENRSANLGVIPANGVVRLPWTVPSTLPSGLTFFLQASTADSAGLRRYSNSSPLTVR